MILIRFDFRIIKSYKQYQLLENVYPSISACYCGKEQSLTRASLPTLLLKEAQAILVYPPSESTGGLRSLLRKTPFRWHPNQTS